MLFAVLHVYSRSRLSLSGICFYHMAFVMDWSGPMAASIGANNDIIFTVEYSAMRCMRRICEYYKGIHGYGRWSSSWIANTNHSTDADEDQMK